MEQSAIHWVSSLGCCCSSHQGSGLKQQHCHEINRKQIHLQLPWLAQGHADCLFQTSSCQCCQEDRKPCWELRALLRYWDGYPPLQTFPALSGARLKIHALLLPPEPTDCRAVRAHRPHSCSSSLLTSKWKWFLSSPSRGTQACPTPDTSCHLPRHPRGCSEMTWDLPGYWLFLGQHRLRCGVGADSSAGHTDPCCSLKGFRRACAEPSRLCLSRGKHPQNVSACCHSITGQFTGGMGKKIGYESTTNHRPYFSAPSQEPLFSLHCPVRVALASLLCPPEVFVPKGILRASRTFVLLSLL